MEWQFPVTLLAFSGTSLMNLFLRIAVMEDVPALRALIDASVRGLQTEDYSPRQIEGALASVYGVDTQLIADSTYFALESRETARPVIVGCAGWRRRTTLFGGDHC